MSTSNAWGIAFIPPLAQFRGEDGKLRLGGSAMPEAHARAFPRYEVEAYVDVSASADLLLYHRIQNLSLGGICIQTKSLEEVGQLVDVVLNFPDLGEQIEVRGQVVWKNREPPQDVGIRWVELD